MMSPAEYEEAFGEGARAKGRVSLCENQLAGLYGSLTRAADLQKAVADLTGHSLRELNGWLAREGCMSGIPSLIHGLILCEAAGRFMGMRDEESNAKPQRPQRGAEIEGGKQS